MTNSLLAISALVILTCIISCTTGNETSLYSEQFRPQYHFTPEQNWTNDPNGLVYYNGEYHLFYQHNPYGNKWGHMSWGHAVSKDLFHWQHLPVAIEEYTDAAGDSVMIFSGSAVVDSDNTSGFFNEGEGGIVAIYTSHVHRNGKQIRQNQSIAYSTDSGRTFKRYEGNPVLDIGHKDFRDPKVFWYEPDKKWIMAAVVPDRHIVQLHASSNLKEWKLLSEFGPLGDTSKIWECPDLVQLSTQEGPPQTKWVMIVSNSHPQGGPYVGMQYFVGEFDGTKFTADNPSKYPLYVDHGKDFYAGVTFNNALYNKTILLGWVNNWAYANDIPTRPWKGAMSLPRELSLYESRGGLRLRQVPVPKVLDLKEQESLDADSTATSFFAEATFIMADTIGQAGFRIFDNTLIGYDVVGRKVFIDRTNSGNTSFHKSFAGVDETPPEVVGQRVKLTVFVDRSIVEVYVNDGEFVLTDLIFPGDGFNKSVDFFGDLSRGQMFWNTVEMRSVYTSPH